MSEWKEPRVLRYLRILSILAVLVVGFWQFARVGFDWRLALEMTDIWHFFVAMATLPVLGFPISVCYIYAGAAFEPWEAILACWAALAINMSVGYWLSSSVFRTPIKAFMDRRNWELPELSEKGQFRFCFLIRTIPGPPFFFQNLALGLAGVPFLTYLWISMLAQGSIAVAMILCSRYLSQDPWGAGGVTVLSILAALLLAKSIKSIKERLKARSEPEASALQVEPSCEKRMGAD